MQRLAGRKGLVERSVCQRQGWLGLMLLMAPAERYFEAPVGKPVKSSWDMVDGLWDRKGGEDIRAGLQEVFECGDEVAVVSVAERIFRGPTRSVPGMDVDQFRADRLEARWYWNLPANGDRPDPAWAAATGEAAQ